MLKNFILVLIFLFLGINLADFYIQNLEYSDQLFIQLVFMFWYVEHIETVRFIIRFSMLLLTFYMLRSCFIYFTKKQSA